MVNRLFAFKLVSLAFAFALVSTHADAHAALVGSSPAPQAQTTAPTMIELHFSEALEPKFSSFVLTKNGASVDVGAVTVEQDNKSLMAMPSMQLPTGDYKIVWHVLSQDAHKSKGEYTFSVR